jgi:dipeptidyl aminopeptidase/acylaminoacyl peptidase
MKKLGKLTLLCAAVCAILITAGSTRAQEKRMTPELLWELGRLGESSVSADGNLVAYTVRHYELSKNKGKSDLHLLNLSSKKDIKILEGYASVNSIQWINTADGERLFMIAMASPPEEDEEGSEDDADEPSSQVWTFEPTTQEMNQITDIEDGVASLKVSPDGTHLAFTRDIKMDAEVSEIYEDLPEADARIIDNLMYRHWNAWHDYKYTHLHVAKINEEGVADEPVDLMDGIYADSPVPPFAGSEQFNWSPDSKEIAYTTKITADFAQSTDSDVYLKQIGSDALAKNITKGMKGYDNDPVYSPDGKYIAFHSMERAGFESDRNRIMIYNRESGSITDATKGLDQTAHGANWTDDSKSIYFTSEYRGTNQIFRVDLAKQGATQVTQGRFNWDMVALLGDGKALCTKMDMIRPNELTVLSIADKADQVVTHINDEIYADLELPTIEERWVEATDGKRIHCWVVYPPNFDPESKQEWPMLTYCQGGPQGQIGQWFSYRWNFHLMASQGYVVLAPNRRGLPGFGREWNDQISGDWGGQAMQDLLSATDDMVKEPYVDKARVGAIGASFGGYTVYWMMGNHADRFATMIAHCGVFNLESMYGSTEELFFVNWDLGGPYWSSPDVQKKYERFSPHKFVGNWKTPLMVIHGEKDFRVPVTQGMEAFTAAQVQGVPSRFLYYPEEGHWVQSPQNGVLWHRVFFEWLDRYCGEEE